MLGKNALYVLNPLEESHWDSPVSYDDLPDGGRKVIRHTSPSHSGFLTHTPGNGRFATLWAELLSRDVRKAMVSFSICGPHGG